MTAALVTLAPILLGHFVAGAELDHRPFKNVAPATVVALPSAALGREISVTVLLPSGYSAGDRRYPVLYLLHGNGQDHTAFARRSWFPSLVSRDMIVVTPQAGGSGRSGSSSDSPARYEDDFVRELVTFMDASYRTIASAQARAVAGVSAGGREAMRLGLTHPHLFGAVGAISATYDTPIETSERTASWAPGGSVRRDRTPVALAGELAPGSAPLLYIACGTQDPELAGNRRFVDALARQQIPYEYRELSPAGSWALWDGQIPEFIDLLSRRWSQGAPSP